MGTASDWSSVLLYGAVWGTAMILLELFEHPSAIKNRQPYLNVLNWAIAGFAFGLVMVFNFRLLHWPLVVITVATITVWVLSGMVCRQKLKRSQSSNSSPSN